MEWVTAVRESGKEIDWAPLMKQIAVPVLLAFGEYDFVAPMTAWTDENLPPTATVEVFGRSGHTPYLEEAPKFVDAVQRWLQHIA